jgi:hypothetical protein
LYNFSIFKEDFNIEDHEKQHDRHAIHEGQVIDVENHVIPINLTVNKHHEGELKT